MCGSTCDFVVCIEMKTEGSFVARVQGLGSCAVTR